MSAQYATLEQRRGCDGFRAGDPMVPAGSSLSPKESTDAFLHGLPTRPFVELHHAWRTNYQAHTRVCEVSAVSTHYHALVWIDHREAKVFHFNVTEVDRATVRSTHPDQHIHHKANSGDSGHAPVDKEFLKRVAQAIAQAGAILITGPASAKTELVAYIKRTQPHLAERISGVEALDHSSDGALLALARTFFKADDRIHAQSHRGPSAT
jgi:hypothetical protein